MKFLFSKGGDFEKRRAELEKVFRQYKADLQRVKSVALKSLEIKEQADTASRALAASYSEQTVEAYVASQLKLSECRLREIAAQVARPGVVKRYEAMLLPLGVTTLKALIAALEAKRKEVVKDERELAAKHSEDFDESGSPHIRRIDNDLREGQRYLDALSRGQLNQISPAITFCLRDSTNPPNENIPQGPATTQPAQVKRYEGETPNVPGSGLHEFLHVPGRVKVPDRDAQIAAQVLAREAMEQERANQA